MHTKKHARVRTHAPRHTVHATHMHTLTTHAAHMHAHTHTFNICINLNLHTHPCLPATWPRTGYPSLTASSPGAGAPSSFSRPSVHATLEAMLEAGDEEAVEGEEDDGVAPQKGARRLSNRQALMGLNEDDVELRCAPMHHPCITHASPMHRPCITHASTMHRPCITPTQVGRNMRSAMRRSSLEVRGAEPCI